MTRTQPKKRLRRRSAKHLAAAVAIGAFLSTDVQAQPAPANRRILILADKPGDPFLERVRAEISSLDLDVVMRPPTSSLDADARLEHAVAAIRMLESRKGVEVWMADEISGRSLLRQVIVDETPGGPDQNLVALQTAELLRTSFFPKASPAAQPPLAVAQDPPPPAVTPSPRRMGENSVQAGIGFLQSPGGVSGALQVWLSLQHMWNRRFGAAVDVSAPIARGSLSGPEGTSDLGAVVVGAEILVRVRSDTDRLVLTAGLGGALASLLVNGQASTEGSKQLVSSSKVAYTGLGYLRITAGLRPLSWFGVGVSGLAGSTTSRVQLRFAGNDAGTWGVPLYAAFLFGEVSWR